MKKEDGQIDWNWPARKIFNRTRGFLPWPGAYSHFRGQMFHIWKSRVSGEAASGATASGQPGLGAASLAPSSRPGRLVVEKKRLLVMCGEGTALQALEVQIEGRKRMPAEAFLNGQRLNENEMLGEETK